MASAAFAALFAAASATTEPASGAEPAFASWARLSAGVASYEENVALQPVDSEWGAPLVELEAGLSWQGRRWSAEVSGQLLATASDEETWAGQGLLFQRNDLEASGGELALGFGPAPIQVGDLRLRPLLTAGGRQVTFERSHFIVQAERSTLGQVDEEYRLAYLGAALDLSCAVREGLELGTRVEFDGVVFSEARNSLVDPVLDGNGGWIARARGEVRWRVGERSTLAAGASFDQQDLSGGSVDYLEHAENGRPSFQSVEWPDNIFSRITADLRLVIPL